MEKQQIKQDQIKKEPLIRIAKRDVLPARKVVLIYAIAIVVSLVLSAIICSLFSSQNPKNIPRTTPRRNAMASSSNCNGLALAALPSPLLSAFDSKPCRSNAPCLYK